MVDWSLSVDGKIFCLILFRASYPYQPFCLREKSRPSDFRGTREEALSGGCNNNASLGGLYQRPRKREKIIHPLNVVVFNSENDSTNRSGGCTSREKSNSECRRRRRYITLKSETLLVFQILPRPPEKVEEHIPLHIHIYMYIYLYWTNIYKFAVSPHRARTCLEEPEMKR